MSVCKGTPAGNMADCFGTCHNECLVEPHTVYATGGIDQDNSGREIPKSKLVI